MEKENSGHGFISGMVLGSFLGIAIGLMIAPQPGDKTREQLRHRVGEISSLGKAAWIEGKDAASQKAAELRSKFEQAGHNMD